MAATMMKSLYLKLNLIDLAGSESSKCDTAARFWIRLCYNQILRVVCIQLQTFFCHDETRSSLASELISGIHGSFVPVLEDEKSISVRTLVDHSIVESYTLLEGFVIYIIGQGFV
jgi:hypothetical protein